MKSFLRATLILLYSLLTTFLQPLLRVLTKLKPRLRAQMQGREPVAVLARRLAPLRARHRRGVLFFCSSAGEYEQARPLIERLEKDPAVYVQVLFFSRSGLDYLEARRDKVAACLAPLGDSTWEWGWLLSALRPDLTVVVRHELWPAFLEVARSYGKLHLIAASRSLGESSSRLKRFVRTQLLQSFDAIHAVSDADVSFFRETYAVPADRLRLAGDPKYDRVLERAAAKQDEAAKLRLFLDGTSDGSRRLIVGSAHIPDVEACLAARARLGAAAANWQVVLAPHDVSDTMVASILALCHGAGVAATRYSEIAKAHATPGRRPVVVLDTMGMLAEVYGAGDAAFVGGALHHQVHNVLEPACRGLALGYGPFYKNSQEAIRFVELGLATVVQDADQFADWWRGLENGLKARAVATRQAVTDLAGATDRIYAEWRQILAL